MRTLSTAMANSVASEEAIAGWLIKVSLDSTYYYTNFEVNTEYGGENYLSRGFEIRDIQQSYNFQADIATIDFDNTNREMSALFLGEDAANKTVICRLAFLNAATKRISVSAEMMRGYIKQYDLNEQKCTISLGSEFMLWSKKSLRLPTPNCAWSFKGTECGYSGASGWCNKTYARCRVLANTSNFGGRRFINDLEGQKIFWGPQGY